MDASRRTHLCWLGLCLRFDAVQPSSGALRGIGLSSQVKRPLVVSVLNGGNSYAKTNILLSGHRWMRGELMSEIQEFSRLVTEVSITSFPLGQDGIVPARTCSVCNLIPAENAMLASTAQDNAFLARACPMAGGNPRNASLRGSMGAIIGSWLGQP